MGMKNDSTKYEQNRVRKFQVDLIVEMLWSQTFRYSHTCVITCNQSNHYSESE
jgi:hypothetical protein